MKSWSYLENFSTYRKSGTEKSNLRSNFTLKVAKMAQKSKPGQNPIMHEPESRELNFVQY